MYKNKRTWNIRKKNRNFDYITKNFNNFGKNAAAAPAQKITYVIKMISQLQYPRWFETALKLFET